MNETVKNILERRSVREYSEEKLTEAQLKTLLDCAMWAPSARNRQGCVVRALTDGEALLELHRDFKNLVGWDAPAYSRWDTNTVYQGAPCLFLIYGDSSMDAGIMVENIAVAAKSIGLESCIIGSVGELLCSEGGEKWKRLLKVDGGLRFQIAIAVGHGAEQPPVKERRPENFIIIDKI